MSCDTPFVMWSFSCSNFMFLKITSKFSKEKDTFGLPLTRIMETHNETKDVAEDPIEQDEVETAEMMTDDGVKKERKKFTLHQKLTFLSAALATLVNYMAFSIISVFYPVVVRSIFLGNWKVRFAQKLGMES